MSTYRFSMHISIWRCVNHHLKLYKDQPYVYNGVIYIVVWNSNFGKSLWNARGRQRHSSTTPHTAAASRMSSLMPHAHLPFPIQPRWQQMVVSPTMPCGRRCQQKRWQTLCRCLSPCVRWVSAVCGCLCVQYLCSSVCVCVCVCLCVWWSTKSTFLAGRKECNW